MLKNSPKSSDRNRENIAPELVNVLKKTAPVGLFRTVLLVSIGVSAVQHLSGNKSDTNDLVLLVKAHDPDTFCTPAYDPELADRDPDNNPRGAPWRISRLMPWRAWTSASPIR